MTICFDRSIESVQRIKNLGMNWLLTGWWGHNTNGLIHDWGEMRDSLPVYLKRWPEVAERRLKFKDIIDAQLHHAAELIEEARRLDMKVAVFLYTPSLPREALDLHPEWASGTTEAQCRVWPISRTEPKTAFCIWTPELAEMLKDTIEELLQSLPPVDAIMYTIGESSLKIMPCSKCENIPQWQSQLRVRQLVGEGARRVNPDIDIMTRMWQMEHPPTTYTSRKMFAETMAYPSEYHKAMAALFEDPEYAYRPDKHVPKFQEALKEETVVPVITRKLSWGDAMLGQPISPWVGSAKGIAKELVEISLEHCHHLCYDFIPCAIVKHIRRYVDHAIEKGVAGIKPSPVEFDVDWGLNMLNIDFVMAYSRTPILDPEEFTKDWLRKRYSVDVPGLARILIDTEDVWTKVITYNGVGTMTNFDIANRPAAYDMQEIKSQSHIWKGAWPDGEQRMALDRESLETNVGKWNGAVRNAEDMCAQVKEIGEALPEKYKKELFLYFETLLVLVKNAALRMKRSFLMWAMEEGTIPATRKAMAALERWNIELERLIASDSYLTELTKKWSGKDGHPSTHMELIPEDDEF